MGTAIDVSNLDLQLLRMPQVEHLTGRRKSALYSDIAAGLLTPPVHPSARASVWPKYEITMINAARLSGASDEDVRRLVARLVERRKKLAASILGEAA